MLELEIFVNRDNLWNEGPMDEYIKTNPPTETTPFILGFFAYCILVRGVGWDVELAIPSEQVASYLKTSGSNVRKTLKRMVNNYYLIKTKTGNYTNEKGKREGSFYRLNLDIIKPDTFIEFFNKLNLPYHIP